MQRIWYPQLIPLSLLMTFPNTILPLEKARRTKQHDDLLSKTSSNTEENSSSSSESSPSPGSGSDNDSATDTDTSIRALSAKSSACYLQGGVLSSSRCSSPWRTDEDSIENGELAMNNQQDKPFHSLPPRIHEEREITVATTNKSTARTSQMKKAHPKSVTFSVAPILVHTVSRVTHDEWPLVYYEQDEIAEFRYAAFLEDCGLLVSDMIPSGG